NHPCVNRVCTGGAGQNSASFSPPKKLHRHSGYLFAESDNSACPSTSAVATGCWQRSTSPVSSLCFLSRWRPGSAFYETVFKVLAAILQHEAANRFTAAADFSTASWARLTPG
ncbi:unnamed protein product, partial [Phaeothamnion confervicola]